jgi:hypothetical protein
VHENGSHNPSAYQSTQQAGADDLPHTGCNRLFRGQRATASAVRMTARATSRDFKRISFPKKRPLSWRKAALNPEPSAIGNPSLPSAGITRIRF